MQQRQAEKPSASRKPPKPPPPPAEVEALKPATLGRASDEDLMRRTQQGDKQAFSLLYERYSASVLSYPYRMLGNLEDVESIGQEVFLRAFRFAPTYRYPQKFSTWLFTITRNLAINQSRRRKRSPIRNITELNLEGIDMSGDPYQVAAHATDEGDLPEQVADHLLDPGSQQTWLERWGPVATPLLWSHAMYLTLALETQTVSGQFLPAT